MDIIQSKRLKQPTYDVTVGLGRDSPHYEPLVPSFGKGVDLRNDP